MDGYANLLFTTSLATHRDGIVDPNDSGAYAGNGEAGTDLPALPKVGTDARILQWEPWVRGYLARFEMLQGITVTHSEAAKTVSILLEGKEWITFVQPDRAVFAAEIPEVLNAAQLRGDRSAEILTQIDAHQVFWSSIVPMRPDMNKYTIELLNLVLQTAVYVELQVKHLLGCLRPINYSHNVQPMITTPGHGSLPAGHATQPYMAAYVLSYLMSKGYLGEIPLLDMSPNPPKLPDRYKIGDTNVRQMMYRSCFRAAYNRVIAGVHFPIDLSSGAMLGIALGELFVKRCLATDTVQDVKLTKYRFETAKYQTQKAAMPYAYENVSHYVTGDITVGIIKPQVTGKMWQKARDDEWSLY
jgi:PAP2 superfamily